MLGRTHKLLNFRGLPTYPLGIQNRLVKYGCRSELVNVMAIQKNVKIFLQIMTAKRNCL